MAIHRVLKTRQCAEDLGRCHSFLGAYLMHLSPFEDGHEVITLLVSALLHLLVVSRTLPNLSAQESQLSQLLGDVVRGLHLLQICNSGVQNSHSCSQTLLSAGILCTV